MKQQSHKNQSEVRKRLSTDRGVTLVELMIAIVIGMILIGSIYGTYISQQRSFTAQDQVAEMNSTSKISLDMIVNNIRETGFGVPDDLTGVSRSGCASGINGFTQKINWADGGTTSTDQITILGGFRLVGNIFSAVSSGSTTLVLDDTSTLTPYQADKSYITIAGISFAIVTAIAGNNLTLQTGLDTSYPAGVPVYLVENVTYQVVNGELQKVRRLAGAGCGTISDTDVIAENIEDFQIAYGYDTNSNGVIDAGEFYNVPPATDRLLRIRVNILARTARPDLNFQGQGNPPAAIENRNHAATNDNFRRRWWQMEVDLRNPI